MGPPKASLQTSAKDGCHPGPGAPQERSAAFQTLATPSAPPIPSARRRGRPSRSDTAFGESPKESGPQRWRAAPARPRASTAALRGGAGAHRAAARGRRRAAARRAAARAGRRRAARSATARASASRARPAAGTTAASGSSSRRVLPRPVYKGGVAQWQSVRFACGKPRVQTPAPPPTHI